jgi:hypothetical protein
MSPSFYDPTRLLRELKGAPLSVLLAFVITRTTLSADWLVTQTGYTDKPVTQALKLLTARGWLTKSMGGWRLCEGVQLPLGLSDSENFRLSSSSSLISGATSYQEEQEEDRKNSDSYHANYRVLKNYGIREPACGKLAGLEHVTPEYIHAHIRQARLDKGTLGTAIHRMMHGWEQPEILEDVREYRRYSSPSDWLGSSSVEESEEG